MDVASEKKAAKGWTSKQNGICLSNLCPKKVMKAIKTENSTCLNRASTLTDLLVRRWKQWGNDSFRPGCHFLGVSWMAISTIHKLPLHFSVSSLRIQGLLPLLLEFQVALLLGIHIVLCSQLAALRSKIMLLEIRGRSPSLKDEDRCPSIGIPDCPYEI